MKVDYKSVSEYGTTKSGDKIYACRLINSGGAQMEVISYGATVTSLKIAQSNGKLVDVVLGFDNIEAYEESFDLEAAPFFGAIVGRYAGRIKDGKFTLNGTNYELYQNNNGNSLHGGKIGFSRKSWAITEVNENSNPSVTLTYCSPAGEEGYPGELTVSVKYTLTDENEFMVEYTAQSSEDTVLNLTHHSYFNIAGHDKTVEDLGLTLYCDKVLKFDSNVLPTGDILKVADTEFDYTNTSRTCPTSIDNTFVTENRGLVAKLVSKSTNIALTVYTDQPGLHIYVGGNCFNKIKGKEQVAYHPKSGICFETQNFPDAPNQPSFPSSVLKKGDTYTQKSVYKFNS